MSASLSHGEWIENRPSTGFRGIDFRELWQYRELAYFLALRDLRVRYKQAAFGLAWAILQPLVGAAVFTIVFLRVAKLPSQGIAYPVFAFVGLSLWSYLSNSVTKETQSLVNNSPLVTKIYFPRVLAPLAAAVPGLVDLVISLVFLAVLMPIYGESPGPAIVTFPLWLLALVVTSLGVGLWLGTLNVRYRDVTQAIGLLIQLWLFLSPVAYPSSQIPAAWRPLYFVNPMAGVLDGFRWSLVGAPWPGPLVFVSVAVAAVLLCGGLLFFQHAERRFADVI